MSEPRNLSAPTDVPRIRCVISSVYLASSFGCFRGEIWPNTKEGAKFPATGIAKLITARAPNLSQPFLREQEGLSRWLGVYRYLSRARLSWISEKRNCRIKQDLIPLPLLFCGLIFMVSSRGYFVTFLGIFLFFQKKDQTRFVILLQKHVLCTFKSSFIESNIQKKNFNRQK